jgi:membrane protease YdiL (CAAX protease family)
VIAALSFVVVYVVVATIPLRPGSAIQQLLPENTNLTVAKMLALTPALLVVSLSNGFEEEFLFRGLFLQKYEALFGGRLANVLQAIIFSIAHLGVTYTPSALVFIVLVVFPLGLLAGYLMRASNSLVVPAIVHGALDMAIYVGFLASVAF